MTSLQTFLDSHRVEKGAEWNLTGMGKFDAGRYFVPDSEYDTFRARYLFDSPEAMGGQKE